MSEEKKVSPKEMAERAVAEERNERAGRVKKAIDEILKAEQCAIVGMPMFAPDGSGRIVADVVVVAR